MHATLRCHLWFDAATGELRLEPRASFGIEREHPSGEVERVPLNPEPHPLPVLTLPIAGKPKMRAHEAVGTLWTALHRSLIEEHGVDTVYLADESEMRP